MKPHQIQVFIVFTESAWADPEIFVGGRGGGIKVHLPQKKLWECFFPPPPHPKVPEGVQHFPGGGGGGGGGGNFFRREGPIAYSL